MAITKKQLGQLQELQLANAVQKITDGKSLTPAEQRLIDAANAKSTPKAKQTRTSRLDTYRWTIERGASEFGLNPRTLAGRIRTQGIEVGADGCYSTLDIAEAVYEVDRLALTRAQTRRNNEEADETAMRNSRERGNLLDLEDFSRRVEARLQEAKQIILESSLPKEKEEALLTKLAAIFAA